MKKYINADKNYSLTDYRSMGASLYDGGWRAEDHDELMQEYGFTEWEVGKICEVLSAIEAANHEPTYTVTGYLHSGFYGVMDKVETDDFSEACDAVHEFCSSGYYTEISNNTEAHHNHLKFDPDTWFSLTEDGDYPSTLIELGFE